MASVRKLPRDVPVRRNHLHPVSKKMNERKRNQYRTVMNVLSSIWNRKGPEAVCIAIFKRGREPRSSSTRGYIVARSSSILLFFFRAVIHFVLQSRVLEGTRLQGAQKSVAIRFLHARKAQTPFLSVIYTHIVVAHRNESHMSRCWTLG
jgi:hypothetical protein